MTQEIKQQNDVDALVSEITALTCERDRLLYTVKAAYRKHHLDDPSIGWEELSTMLLTTLCENMGDKGFQEWLSKQVW